MSNNWVGKIAIVLAIATIGYVVYDKSTAKRSAFINTKEVFNDFTLKKELTKKYESETLFTKKMLDSISFNLQSRAKVLEMNPKASNEEVQLFLADKEEYLSRKEIFMKEKQSLSAKYDEEILKQMNQYIMDFGKENKYTYVFGTDGNGNLMYAAETENITKVMIEYINKKYEGK